MTREELKEHCKKQVEQVEMWAKHRGEEPSGRIYEEHKLVLELFEQEPKWIPCTQELPELNKKILVTAYHRTCYGMMISRSGNGGFPIFRLQDSLNERTVNETVSHGQYSQGKIDAWMPLPEPYREVEE